MVGIATEAGDQAVLADRKSHLSEHLDNENGISFDGIPKLMVTRCASAIQLVRPLESIAETGPALGTLHGITSVSIVSMLSAGL